MLFAVEAAHVTIESVAERLTYPVYHVAIFNNDVEGGPEADLEVPFLPYPGLVIILDDAAWEVRTVQVSPYEGTKLAERLKDRLPQDLPIPVSVTTVNTAPEPNTNFIRPSGS